jgi:hypothetical protein
MIGNTMNYKDKETRKRQGITAVQKLLPLLQLGVFLELF